MAAPAVQPSPLFTGFSDEALLFYEGLEADNSRTYWTDHADRYERAVRAPMLALLAAVEPEFGPMKFFRPQRDLRFSGYGLFGEELKRMPRGYDAGHPRAHLLRRKGLAAHRDAGTPDWLATPACLDAVVTTWRRFDELSDWLGRHVGPPEPATIPGSRQGDTGTRPRR